MAAGNIFKYTFLTLVFFCGTKILHFLKFSTQQMAQDNSDKFNTFGKQPALLFNIGTHVGGNKSDINESDDMMKTVTTGSMKWAQKTNSTILTNRLQRKRKLLSQMLDKYSKVKERERTKFGIKDSSAFYQVCDDIFALSAFYDDRGIKINQDPVVRVLTISNLHSTASLECRYSAEGVGQRVPAIRQELSDNHGKPFGGVMYLCNVPHTDRNKPPKTVYLQCLLTREDNFSKVTSKLVAVEVIPLEMSIWKPAIYHNADNLKMFTPENLHANDAKYFLETFPNNSDLKKIQKIDQSQTSLEATKGRQINAKMLRDHDKLPAERDGKLPRISVCVPPLFGDIKLSEFIQFVEILKILGASQIFFYKMNISSDTERMLDYYQAQGIVTLNNWQLSGGLHNSRYIWYYGQNTAQQDCLYRNIGKFDFTAFIDIDEIIVPYSDSDWPKMIQRLENTYTEGENTDTVAFIFRSGFFEPDKKLNSSIKTKHQKLSFLRNIYRNEIISSVRTKMIVKPDYVEHIGIHHVSRLVYSASKLDIVHVPVTTALVHHNRKCTPALDTEMHCGKYVTDTSVLKYSDNLLINYEQALENNMKYFRSIR